MTGSDQHNASSGRAGRGFVIFAALIIIAAGLKAAQAIVVPMLLAAFIATIAASPMFWFKAKGMSNGLALGSVVLGIFLALGLIAALLTQSTSAFSAKRRPIHGARSRVAPKSTSLCARQPAAASDRVRPSQSPRICANLSRSSPRSRCSASAFDKAFSQLAALCVQRNA